MKITNNKLTNKNTPFPQKVQKLNLRETTKRKYNLQQDKYNKKFNLKYTSHPTHNYPTRQQNIKLCEMNTKFTRNTRKNI